MMIIVSLVAGGGLALSRMRVDIFPPINQPQIVVFCNFGGMDPGQMEGLLVNQFELAFQYVDGVKNVESRCISQVALIKIAFYPGTDMAKAMASVVSQANRAQASMPPNVLPPLIMQLDAGSVPVGYLVLQSKNRTLGQMGDLAQMRLRALVQSNVPGTMATSPFGTNARAIVISVDPDRLRSYDLTPDEVVTAIRDGNFISPSGNVYIQDEMPMVPNNAMIRDPQDFGNIPIKPGSGVYLRDVGTISDSTDLNYGYGLVNGHKSVYLPIVKKSTASTLQVVSDIRKSMPLFKSVLPDDVDLSFEFDESPAVVSAITNVFMEGLIGTILTGLMVLVFLRDWRSVIVVVLNIPLALLGSLFGLWVTGYTINIMTLGGLALAIGILVDVATVSIENIHVQMTRTKSLARAVERGSHETAVPRLLALVCVLSVFIPAFIMAEPIRSLFVPLALAVGFAMVSSYVLSSMFVPVISVWLIKHHGAHEAHHASAGRYARFRRRNRIWFHQLARRHPKLIPSFFARSKPPRRTGSERSPAGMFERFQNAFGGWVQFLVRWRWIAVPAYVVVSLLILLAAGSQLGTELFPQVDSGEFVLRFRAPPGSNFEITRQIATKVLQVVDEEAGTGNVRISMGFAGQQAPTYSMNNLILFMRGPDDGQLRIALDEESAVRLAPLREQLRKALPEKVKPWLTGVLEQQGLTAESAKARADQVTFGFEPGDIVSEVMSFGSPTPIEVAVVSPNLADAREHADRIKAELEKIPYLRDVAYHQSVDYPTMPVQIDRERAGLSGLTAKQVADAILVSTSSSRYVARNYWRDPKSGVDYQVEVLVPTKRMNSTRQIETIPLRRVAGGSNLLVRDVATVSKGSMPGQYDRNTMQRFLSLTANVEGEDLGRAARQINEAIAAAGQPPKGARIDIRGQISPMQEMFKSMSIGLAIAVLTIMVLLTAYFESPRLALAAVSAVPGVLSGVALILYVTNTSLNIESFMGSIMCIGVSLSNSVMMVSFIARDWHHGKSSFDAAWLGAQERLRPILMTACAMTVGMVPMALALERGSEMQAPLGRAVIGGLVMSTFATLLIVPSVFALLVGNRTSVSASVHPDDPKSQHYHPLTIAEGGGPAGKHSFAPM
ncbi:MAG TPA: efflux RND transporter permease subunit, partial [Lacipirellulaceae bacterium]|nr:efflux RND transporter permease subunit [Lacipirellulaceae bacterium]